MLKKLQVDPEIRPAVLHVQQAAAYLGVSVTHLYRIIGAGDLQFAKLGKRTVIRVADLDAYLAKRVGASDIGRPIGHARAVREASGVR